MSLEDHLAAIPELDGLSLPDLGALSAAAERVLARWPDMIVNPPDSDPDRLVREMHVRVFNDRWDGTPLSFVLAAARALYDGERLTRPSLAMLRAFYTDEIRASTREAFLGGMVQVYLGSYQPGALHTRALAAALSDARPRLGLRWRRLLTDIPEILDPERAPEAIAGRMMTLIDPWHGLRLLGLRAPHAPGVMDHAHRAFVARLAPRLGERQAVDRLLGWLRPDPLRPPRLSGAAPALEAILAPWQAADPDPEEIAYLAQSLVGLYGDPRVVSGGVWAELPDPTVAMLRRWLTGETIRVFHAVVMSAGSSLSAAHGQLWQGLHGQGRIAGAWAAFSSDAAAEARAQARASGARGTIGHGWQTAGGSLAGVSLLVLDIGSRIVIASSDEDTVRVFAADDPGAPRLYQSAYNCEKIRLLPGEIRFPEAGDWDWPGAIPGAGDAAGDSGSREV